MKYLLIGLVLVLVPGCTSVPKCPVQTLPGDALCIQYFDTAIERMYCVDRHGREFDLIIHKEI